MSAARSAYAAAVRADTAEAWRAAVRALEAQAQTLRAGGTMSGRDQAHTDALIRYARARAARRQG